VVEAIVLEGDAAAGTGALFQSFDRPNVSEEGHVLFGGDTNAPTTSDEVLYVGTVLVAQEGSPAPGVTGGAFGPLETFETAHQVSMWGDVAFIATITGVPTESDRAVYGGAILAAREGQEAAGIAGRHFADFGFAAVLDDGTVCFLADLDGATANDSVIIEGGAIRYREGDLVPGLTGVTWDGNFDEIQWNGAGDLLFEGNTSLPTSEDAVIWRRMHAGAEIVEGIVAREGQVVDLGSGAADTLGVVSQTAIAEDGRWALRASLVAAPDGADGVILAEGAGLVAREGDAVPGLPGATIGELEGVDCNSLGDVVYSAAIIGGAPGVDQGIFANGTLLVATGDAAPELDAGTLFTGFGFEDLVVNDRREVIFAATYGGAVSGDGIFRLLLPAACAADVDGSGSVDLADAQMVLADWGTCGGSGCTGDVDGDGMVGFDDLLAILAAWGVCR
jgi:hypothetical protein